MGAADYGSRLILLRATKTTQTTGQPERVYNAVRYLWAGVEETNARREDVGHGTQTGVDVEIRIRNYPDVTTDDLLKDKYFGYVFRIVGIRNGDDELIVDAYRWDTLVDYTIGSLTPP